MPEITVLTCTYNRAKTLPRVFSSLQNSTLQDFEWLVVDDGSTDGTAELIAGYKQQASFPIQYIAKENGGKHTASNRGVMAAQGRYIAFLDSDDEILPEGLAEMYAAWQQLPDPESYWAVRARCVDHRTGKPMGKAYPENINSLSRAAQYRALHRTGNAETIMMCRRDLLQKHLFPEPPGLKFVFENCVWYRIGAQYRAWYLNTPARRYYYLEQTDALSVTECEKPEPYYFCCLYFINEIFPLRPEIAQAEFALRLSGLCYSGIRQGYSCAKIRAQLRSTAARFAIGPVYAAVYGYIRWKYRKRQH